MLWFQSRRPQPKRKTFENDTDFIDIIDIISRSYGKLPSEILSLSWGEIFLCVRCIAARSQRAQEAMKKRNKDDMIFPVISVMEMIDLV